MESLAVVLVGVFGVWLLSRVILRVSNYERWGRPTRPDLWADWPHDRVPMVEPPEHSEGCDREPREVLVVRTRRGGLFPAPFCCNANYLDVFDAMRALGWVTVGIADADDWELENGHGRRL